MVFLQRIELANLVQTGRLEPDTTLPFAHAPKITGTVTERGRLRLSSGKAFEDPDEAAKAAALERKPWLYWRDWKLAPNETLATLATQSRNASVRARPSDPISRLGLSSRTTNALLNAGISRVRDVVRRYDVLRDVPGIGTRSFDEIASSLAASELDPHPPQGKS
jgi:hypothetical protein